MGTAFALDLKTNKMGYGILMHDFNPRRPAGTTHRAFRLAGDSSGFIPPSTAPIFIRSNDYLWCVGSGLQEPR